MQELKAKLEIMELYSMYLLYLDERKFDNNSFSRLFTENAEMRAPSKMHSFNVCKGIKEIRELHLAIFRQFESTHHSSSNFLFEFSSDGKLANVKCKNSASYQKISDEHEATFSNWNSDFTVIFSDVGWRIQSLNVKMKYTYNFSISSEDQELFL